MMKINFKLNKLLFIMSFLILNLSCGKELNQADLDDVRQLITSSDPYKRGLGAQHLKSFVGKYTSYKASDGTVYKVGDILTIGVPSLSNKRFDDIFIYDGGETTPLANVTKNHTGRKVKIEWIERTYSGSKGYITVSVVKEIESSQDYYVYFEYAILSRELYTGQELKQENISYDVNLNDLFKTSEQESKEEEIRKELDKELDKELKENPLYKTYLDRKSNGVLREDLSFDRWLNNIKNDSDLIKYIHQRSYNIGLTDIENANRWYSEGIRQYETYRKTKQDAVNKQKEIEITAINKVKEEKIRKELDKELKENPLYKTYLQRRAEGKLSDDMSFDIWLSKVKNDDFAIKDLHEYSYKSNLTKTLNANRWYSEGIRQYETYRKTKQDAVNKQKEIEITAIKVKEEKIRKEFYKLFRVVTERGLYTKSFEEFKAQYSDESKRDKLFRVVTERGLYNKSYGEFNAKYFSAADVNKQNIINKQKEIESLAKTKVDESNQIQQEKRNQQILEEQAKAFEPTEPINQFPKTGVVAEYEKATGEPIKQISKKETPQE